MLLVSSCVPVVTWLCSRVMRFQSRPINWPLLTIESPVAQWLAHPTRSRRVVGSNPIWGSDFFRVLQTFNLSCVCCFILHVINLNLLSPKPFSWQKKKKHSCTLCVPMFNVSLNWCSQQKLEYRTGREREIKIAVVFAVFLLKAEVNQISSV